MPTVKQSLFAKDISVILSDAVKMEVRTKCSSTGSVSESACSLPLSVLDE